jgi:hypothetical protein
VLPPGGGFGYCACVLYYSALFFARSLQSAVQCFASWLSMCKVEMALIEISIVAMNVNVYSVIRFQL